MYLSFLPLSFFPLTIPLIKYLSGVPYADIKLNCYCFHCIESKCDVCRVPACSHHLAQHKANPGTSINARETVSYSLMRFWAVGIGFTIQVYLLSLSTR